MSKPRRALELLRDEGVESLLRRAALFGRDAAGTGLATVTQRVNRTKYRLAGDETRLMDEDWDALILLDGCRYDQFERLNALPGELESRVSLGSTTKEFLRENFVGERHWDTVYVTASPMYRTVEMDGAFHDVVDVWRTDWDEDLQTVPPDAMAAAAIEARERFPEKRLLVHFMQPHYPFIGETGRAIPHSGYERTRRLVETGSGSWDNPRIWSLVWSGEVDEDTARRAYDENLELAFPHVERLLDAFDGRTVVTSDHGNLLGERVAPLDGPRYGHAHGLYVDVLRKVPWLVVEGEERIRTRSEVPAEGTTRPSAAVAERLADLGYHRHAADREAGDSRATRRNREPTDSDVSPVR